MTDLPRVVAESDVGSVAVVEIWRKNKKIIIKVELVELPEQTYVKSKSSKNPYGMGNAGKKIAEVLANIPINKDLIRKRMTIDGS